MTHDEAEGMAAAVRATMPLSGEFTISRVETQEALPGGWVTVVWFAGHGDPCVMGREPETRAWAEAHGKRIEGSVDVPAWNRFGRRVQEELRLQEIARLQERESK